MKKSEFRLMSLRRIFSLSIIKKEGLLKIFCLISIIVFPGFTQKKTIAVTDLLGTLDTKELKTLTERLVLEFTRIDTFIVLERNQMEQILKEQGFQQTGCTSSDCVIEVGQLLGVQYIVAGNIGKVGKIYSISLRLIDVKTGRIYTGASLDIDGSIEEVLKRGIPSIVQRLISPPSEKPLNRFNFRKAGGISCIGAGTTAAALAVYFFVEKNRLHNKYLEPQPQSEMNTYFGRETTAYYRFLGSAGVAAVMAPAAFFLLRHVDNNNEKTNGNSEPEVSLFFSVNSPGIMFSLKF